MHPRALYDGSLPAQARWVARNKGLAASVLLGLACVVVGILKASQALLFLVFQRERRCETIPCGNDPTYVTVGLFALLAIGGVLLVAGVLVLHLKGRLTPSK